MNVKITAKNTRNAWVLKDVTIKDYKVEGIIVHATNLGRLEIGDRAHLMLDGPDKKNWIIEILENDLQPETVLIELTL
jgi:hypothetical protein